MSTFDDDRSTKHFTLGMRVIAHATIIEEDADENPAADRCEAGWVHAREGSRGTVEYVDELGYPTVRFDNTGTATLCFDHEVSEDRTSTPGPKRGRGRGRGEPLRTELQTVGRGANAREVLVDVYYDPDEVLQCTRPGCTNHGRADDHFGFRRMPPSSGHGNWVMVRQSNCNECRNEASREKRQVA